MGGTVMVDVLDRLSDAVDHTYIEDVIIIFGEKVLVGGAAEFRVRSSEFGGRSSELFLFRHPLAVERAFLSATELPRGETPLPFFGPPAVFPPHCTLRDVALWR